MKNDTGVPTEEVHMWMAELMAATGSQPENENWK
jgi:hypothetical protein